MNKQWNTVFKGTIEDRDVIIQEYCEGGYIAITTRKAEDFPNSSLGYPGSSVGNQLEFEGNTLDILASEMIEDESDGFSSESISTVVESIKVKNQKG